MLARLSFRLGLLVLALSLGACASTRLIDSDVQSFNAAVPAERPATFRFERLPSQDNRAAQDALEAMATVALAKVGLTPAPLVAGAVAGTAAAAPGARYALLVSAQVSAIVSPYDDSPFYGGIFGHLRPWRGFGFGLAMEPSWYRHAVRIVLRDSHSGQVAFETSASFDGPWNDSARILPVVLDAALQGYPNPPQGPRKITIELTDEPSEAP